jgi:geranylgeranyl pyrophosphate synthase
MSNRKNLVLQARALLYEYGQKGLDKAREIMLQEKIPYQPLQEAVQYFMASWEDVLHPALLSLSCEAVGGNPEDTTNVAAALVLLSGGADLHDDIIDQSVVKDSKPTVFGKFGKDLTVLAGDVLLFKGLYTLHNACDNLSQEQRQSILELTKQAFFAVSSIEAKETSLRRKTDSAEEYFEMVKMKSAITEATMKMGVILAKGTSVQMEILGSYGRTFSILFALRDEFIDTFEVDELTNRAKNECLPLPVLLSYKNTKNAKNIAQLISGQITETEVERLLDIVLCSKETKGLKKEMFSMVKAEGKKLRLLKMHKSVFMLLLKSTVEDL